jgi:2-amino-4-hydroxy-6-hydroxymethyldihydropteridine diphosphokinase
MEALLLLGGNIGEVSATLYRAEAMLGEQAGTVLSRSRDHWTEPWGFHDERLFLNRALLVRTGRSPESLLEQCLDIERQLGRTRERGQGYAARTIDIDLLLCEDRVISSPALTIPHPRMHERAFALAPAADVAPDRIHPLLHRTMLTLLKDVLPKT